MILKANAKINLSLDLTGLLPDGYHAINTVMQSVSLCDIVTVKNADAVSLSCSVPGIPTDERNTAYKAAKYFFEKSGITGGADISIEKHIPSEAGLAGGSADAAAVLYALNEMYPGALSEKELFDIALRVGADVPFCLAGGTRLCLSKGEEMTALPPFGAFVLLAKPRRGVSTGAAFKRFDSAVGLEHPDNERVFACYAASEGEKAAAYSLNIFEQLVELPECERIKSTLTQSGAYYASMSGSGSCFFGLFRDEDTCNAAEKKLKELVPFTAVCKTAHCGVEPVAV